MKTKLKNRLSAPGLLEASRVSFSRIRDRLSGKTHYPLSDCIMSALALFSLKYSSLLQFEQSQDNEKVRHNLKTLYGITQVPSDTYMRERLDPLIQNCCNPRLKPVLARYSAANNSPHLVF